MAPQMKGLTQFIVDIRNSQDAEEERRRVGLEVANIKSKFAQANLNSYQRKKYLCKLLYVHLMGYSEDAELGFQQALQMATSLDFSEKQLGYFSTTLLQQRTGPDNFVDLLEETRHFVMADLRSNSQDANCLALLFLASNFNVMSPSYLSRVEDVSDLAAWNEITDLTYTLCMSPTVWPTTRMKAVTALYTMLKTSPHIIEHNDTWIPRLLAVADDESHSVVLSAIPLVLLIISHFPHYAKSVAPAVANRLYSLVVEQTCPQEQFYHDTPNPWLCVKLLQLVEQFFLPLGPAHVSLLLLADLDHSITTKLRLVISRSILNVRNADTSLQAKLSQLAILFQAVSVVTFLDASEDAITGAVLALLSLLEGATEKNTRYLVIDALIKLAARSSYFFPYKDHLERMFEMLADKDSLVRKKTLDLLFTICDAATYMLIVSHLLDYLPNAELALKPDVSVKVAVLAENFATDSTWYVSTMLRLLSLGGLSSHIHMSTGKMASSGEIWERIVQIIVNNEGIQTTALRYLSSLLTKSQTQPSALVNVAAFVFGEYGHKLVEKSGPAAVLDQVELLMTCYFSASLGSRPMLLHAFLKYVSRYPDYDFVPQILDLYESETLSIDLEIQSRAHEYLRLARFLVGDDAAERAFAKSVIRPMPPFESRISHLEGHLGSIKVAGRSRSSSTINLQKTPSVNVKVSSVQKGEAKSGIAPPPPPPPRVRTNNSGSTVGSDPFGDRPSKIPQLSSKWQEGYMRMSQYDAGIFYEDPLIKITYRVQKQDHVLTIRFIIINNSAEQRAPVTAFTVSGIHNMSLSENPRYVVSTTHLPDPTFSTKTTMAIEVKVRDVVEDRESPIIAMSYKCGGSFNTVTLKIPVTLLKTLSGTALSSLDEFKRRWLQIGESLGLHDGEARGIVSAGHRNTTSNVVRVLLRLGFAIVHKTPDGGGILVMGAGILRTMKSNYGVLLTVKSTDDLGMAFEVVVRSTGGGVAAVVYGTLAEILGKV